MNPHPLPNGVGVTIKPSGDVYFYGIDNKLLANIHSDTVDMEFFKNIVRNNDFIKTLYTTPFLDLINIFSKNEDVKKLINDVNNPYWVIKELLAHDKSLLQRIAS